MTKWIDNFHFKAKAPRLGSQFNNILIYNTVKSDSYLLHSAKILHI